MFVIFFPNSFSTNKPYLRSTFLWFYYCLTQPEKKLFHHLAWVTYAKTEMDASFVVLNLLFIINLPVGDAQFQKILLHKWILNILKLFVTYLKLLLIKKIILCTTTMSFTIPCAPFNGFIKFFRILITYGWRYIQKVKLQPQSNKKCITTFIGNNLQNWKCGDLLNNFCSKLFLNYKSKLCRWSLLLTQQKILQQITESAWKIY